MALETQTAKKGSVRRTRGTGSMIERRPGIWQLRAYCGKNERGYKCRGGSNITNHDGSLLAEIWDDEGVIYADVDPADRIPHRFIHVRRALHVDPAHACRRG